MRPKRSLPEGSSAAAKRRKTAADNIPSEDEHEHIEYVPKGKSKAKGKTKGLRKSRNAGKLAGLMDITLDVFFEIVSHLRPIDLLQLCRVSKHFRKTFMSKSARSLWITARKNVDGDPVPDPPPGISEPKLAALIYEHICFLCGAGRALKYDLELRVRLCGACWRNNVKRGNKLVKEYGKTLPQPLIFQLLTTTSDHPNTGTIALKRGMHQPWLEYYAPEFKSVADKYLSLKPEDPNLLETFVKEREAFVDSIKESTKVLVQWNRNQRSRKAALENDASSSRMLSIRQRLYELGYATDDMPPLGRQWGNWEHMLTQPRPLTERIWKNIRPKLEEEIERYRAYRLRQEKALRARKRLIELQDQWELFEDSIDTCDGPYPIFPELKEHAAVVAVLEEDDSNIVLDKARFDEHVVPIAERLKAIYRQGMIEALRTHYEKTGLGEGLPPPEDSDSLLYRATSLFADPFEFRFHLDDIPTLYSFGELMQHIWETYGNLRNGYTNLRRPDVKYEIYSESAAAALKTLGLPESTPYSEISGKAVCTCGQYKQPNKFSLLVQHILCEQDICEVVRRRYKPSELNRGIPLPDDHSFSSGTPFLKVLKEREEPPPMYNFDSALRTTLAQSETRHICKICMDLAGARDALSLGFEDKLASEVPPVYLIWHINYKHGKQPTLSDTYAIADEDEDDYFPWLF